MRHVLPAWVVGQVTKEIDKTLAVRAAAFADVQGRSTAARELLAVVNNVAATVAAGAGDFSNPFAFLLFFFDLVNLACQVG